MKAVLGFLTAATALVAASHAGAYQVAGEPEKGFYIADISSSAPLRVEDGGWGAELLTPQELLDRRCPGAKVSEINIARVKSYAQRETSVQIVFVMPAQGCIQKVD